MEVLVSGVRECEHYTTRSLTLKVCVRVRVCVCVCPGSAPPLTFDLCSVGTKPASCSITGSPPGLTTRPPTPPSHCCSWWPRWRRIDGRRPPGARSSSTAGREPTCELHLSQLPIILCFRSAGIGRTGCFIATTIGCLQLQAEGVVDVLNITCQLRADR